MLRSAAKIAGLIHPIPKRHPPSQQTTSALDVAGGSCIWSGLDRVEETKTPKATRKADNVRRQMRNGLVINPSLDRLPDEVVKDPKVTVPDSKRQRPQKVVEDGEVAKAKEEQAMLKGHLFKNRDDGH